MIIDKNKFENLESFIEHLKTKDEIVGIVEYGGRNYSNMCLGGDYDLTVILSKPLFKSFTGVHFHIAGIPVDCMMISLEDFTKDIPDNEFMLVHLNCNIIFDRDGSVSKVLERIKADWQMPETLSQVEVNLFRFTFQHVLDKLEYRLYDNKLYSNYFVYASFDWYLECYSRMNNLEPGKPKLQFEYIKKNNKELFNAVNRLYETNDLQTKFEMLRLCAELMLKSIGGPWKKNEVLFHLVSDEADMEKEQRTALELLWL